MRELFLRGLYLRGLFLRGLYLKADLLENLKKHPKEQEFFLLKKNPLLFNYYLIKYIKISAS